VKVPLAVEIPVAPADRVIVTSEEQVLSEEQPRMYIGGTTLAKTLGPVDTGTRLPMAIIPESVRVHSTPDGGTVYGEGKDYSLEHYWGGMSRIEGGRIAKGQKVYIDYEVYLQRIDAVQVSPAGGVTVKKGKAVPVCPEIPAPDEGCAVLANIYIPYQTTAITAENIYPLPAEDVTWRDFIKVSGRRYLKKTLSLLKAGKPVTIICWGDSVTTGGSSSTPGKCYVELFRARLKAAYPHSEITLINAGIGGSSTESRRDGFQKEVLDYKPDLITVEFVNDVGMAPEKIEANWTEFIARARQALPEVEFILLTPHFMQPDWMGNFQNSVPAMRRVAAERKVALGDTANIWASLRGLGIPYETLEANAINHPNDLGHEFFTATLMKLMSPAGE
jgi:lysophospholipase L1-like esterase